MALRWQGLELLNFKYLQKMNNEQNVEGLNVSPAIAKPMLAAGWISVKERMPQDVTPVLVFGYCCDVCHNVRIAEYEVDGWWESFHGTDLHFEPEYWMPLPVPEGLACR